MFSEWTDGRTLKRVGFGPGDLSTERIQLLGRLLKLTFIFSLATTGGGEDVKTDENITSAA